MVLWLCFWFVSAHLITTCSGKLDPDIQKVLDTYKELPECVFNFTQINSKTIKHLPKTCYKIYGVLKFNEKTDLSFAQLKEAFQNFTRIVGGIHFNNTNLTSLSIFTPSPKKGFFELYCGAYGFYVENNKYLRDGNLIANTRMFPYPGLNEDVDSCNVTVRNNPKLNMENLCDQEELAPWTDTQTVGNKKDCGCEGNKPSKSSLQSYQNCTSTFNGLKLIGRNVDPPNFQNIQFIRGNVDIQNSNIYNLSFLQNWDRWKVRANKTRVLNIQDCLQMTRFMMPVSKIKIENMIENGTLLANIEFVHPNFCVTVEEMIHLFELDIVFENIHAKFCEEMGDVEKLVVCLFTSMKDLPDNCDGILGNLKIESGDEEHFPKLRDLQYLFGSLVINNTQLKDLNELNNLQYIAALFGEFGRISDLSDEFDSTPVVQIIGNKELKHVTIPSLRSVTARDFNAKIENNHPDSRKFEQDGTCKLVGKFGLDERWYENTVWINDYECDEWIEYVDSGTRGTIVIFVTLMVLGNV